MSSSQVAIFFSGPGIQRTLNIVPDNVVGFFPASPQDEEDLVDVRTQGNDQSAHAG